MTHAASELHRKMKDALSMQDVADEYMRNVEVELRQLPSIGDDLLNEWRAQEAEWLLKVRDQGAMRGVPSPYQVEEQYRE